MTSQISTDTFHLLQAYMKSSDPFSKILEHFQRFSIILYKGHETLQKLFWTASEVF